MSKQSVDQLLDGVSSSIKSTSKSVDALIEAIDSYGKEYPEMVENLRSSLAKHDTENEPKAAAAGVSLLSLKNASLLGYLDTLSLIVQSKLDALQIGGDKVEEMRAQAVQNSVVHRVTLDKGIKPLEKRLNYQLDKLMDTYRRREREEEEAKEKAQAREEDKRSESADGADSADSAEEDADMLENDSAGLRFRPNAAGFIRKGADKRHEGAGAKYRPPKISAALPPSMQEEQNESKQEGRQRNLQSMDEYLRQVGDAPSVEASVGATIINGGRDMKSQKQIEKEQEVTRYEEENFVRLPASKAKESKRDRDKRMRNEFFGEDWSMFGNSRDISDAGGIKRKRKQSAWQRARKRMDK